MAEKPKPKEVKERGFVDRVNEILGRATRGNPYSGSGSAERMKRLTGDMPESGVPATPEPQSMQQYRHERDAGDPVALSMSYDQWKKLG